MLTMANGELTYIEKMVVTPVGDALWAKVNTVIDEYDNGHKYVMNMTFPEQADEDMMKAKFDKYLADAKALPENKGKKWRPLDDAQICYKVDEKTGKTYFTFKTNALRKIDGKDVQTYVSVWDGFKNRIANDVAIGNGSKIQVRFSPAWRYKNKDGNGLSMFMTGIVVRDLIEFGGGSAEGFDFDTPPAADIPEDEIPF